LSKINPLNAYKETKIRTASRGQLIIMIYDEAIKQIDIAVSAMESESKKLDAIHNAIVKAQDLVTELAASLDFERGGEIAKGLFSLYMFFRGQLLEANLKKKPDTLKSVRSMLAELRDAWVQIVKAGADGERSVPSGVNIAG
jgi:flagellar secretion chaperone FliS